MNIKTLRSPIIPQTKPARKY